MDKQEFLKNFINIKNIINLDVMKCYYILFKEDGLLHNIGSYILLSIIFIFIISLIIFICKDYRFILNQINQIKKSAQEKNKKENKSSKFNKIEMAYSKKKKNKNGK